MKIAIVGSGISGLGAAYLLHPDHDITLYETNHELGGHSRTVTVKTPDGDVPVDTGFIVCNDRNYPHLMELFDHLQVPLAKSDMSFGVSIDQGWLEYGTCSLPAIMAQKINLLRPAFWRMVVDVFRFNRNAMRYVESDVTLGQALQEMGMSRWFRDYYLLAMGGAIWSTPLMGMLDFPVRTFVRFFHNHGLLSVHGQPQWYTVVGGSREYVTRLSEPFREHIRLNCGVTNIIRQTDGVDVVDQQGNREQYDQVVLASHADQSLAMLERPTALEQEIIGAFRYQPNAVVLHRDTSFMPRQRQAWASWVYLSESREDANPAVSLSYWMNRLQPLPTSHPVIVTLNPGRQPDPALVHDRYQFEHPIFDEAAIAAQSRLGEVQGKDRIWYCGAWQRYGFHEDGLLSAVQVAQALGSDIPWQQ